MNKITDQMTLQNIVDLPELAEYKKYIKYLGNELDLDSNDKDPEFDIPLSELGWSGPIVLKGTSFLLDRVQKGKSSMHPIYSEEDCKQNPRKRDVNVVRLVPDKIDPQKPYIILCSGGAYICVCHHVEAYPTAAHFVEAGYQVFVLTYRVRVPGTLPVALTDVAAAIQYIQLHEKEFELNGNNYAIGGYSAGANLIATWGTSRVGYKSFALPKPKAMFPIYAVVDFSEIDAEGKDHGFVTNMLGEKADQETVAAYDVLSNVDQDYPPCYLVCGKDDEIVSCANSEKMKDKLAQIDIPVILEEADHAPHGFGDGTGFSVAGWPERAMAFLENVITVEK